jgi:hypothetical protein
MQAFCIRGSVVDDSKVNFGSGKFNIMREIACSKSEKAKVRCYGADDIREGVAINHHEGVDVSITSNSTNPTRFQHPVAGTYKKERRHLIEAGGLRKWTAGFVLDVGYVPDPRRCNTASRTGNRSLSLGSLDTRLRATIFASDST